MEFKLSTQAEFAMPVYGGIFNIFEFAASGGAVNPKRIERGMHLPTKFDPKWFPRALQPSQQRLGRLYRLVLPLPASANPDAHSLRGLGLARAPCRVSMSASE
jgi:hypothetical protein